MQDEVGSLTRPVRELKGFRRVDLAAGASTRLRFELGPAELGFFTNQGRYVVEPGFFSVFVGTNADATLHGRFELRR